MVTRRLVSSSFKPNRIDAFQLFHRTFFHNQLAVHDHPVAGEGAEIGIAAGLVGGAEPDCKVAARQDDVGVGQDVVGVGNVLPDRGFRVGDQAVRQFANAPQRTRFRQRPVVRHDIGIDQRKLNGLARLNTDCPRLIRQIAAGLDSDSPRWLDLLGKRIRNALGGHPDRQGSDVVGLSCASACNRGSR